MLRQFLSDLRAPLERDPAATSWLEVVLAYPGFHALTAHRFVHRLYRAGFRVPARILSHFARFLTGIEIHPGATIGQRVFIDHGLGVVIGETAEVGDGCTIYQGVTLGGTSTQRVKRHPTLEENVVVGANASVIGAIVVGKNARVGSGSVVVKDVPANATVVGVPGRIVAQNGKPVRLVPDRPQYDLPDPQGALMNELARRIERLETRLAADDVSEAL